MLPEASACEGGSERREVHHIRIQAAVSLHSVIQGLARVNDIQLGIDGCFFVGREE